MANNLPLLKIPESAIPDIVALCRHGPETYKAARESVLHFFPGDAAKPRSGNVDRSAILQLLEPHFKDDTSAVLRQCLALQPRAIVGPLASVHDLLSAIGRSLETTNIVEHKPKHDWNSIVKSIESLIELDLFRYCAKSLDLFYEQSTIISGTRIITDARVIFDTPPNTHVRGLSIIHTLRISSNDDDDLLLALDRDQLLKLQMACKRALDKERSVTETAERSGLVVFDMLDSGDVL